MTLDEYRAISKALYADIDAVLAKHGLKAKKFNAAVEPIAGTVRLSLALADANMKATDGSATTPEAERWKRYAAIIGVKPEWLWQTFRIGNRAYTVMGLRDTRGEKNVVIARDDGKRFVISAKTVVSYFDAHDAGTRLAG